MALLPTEDMHEDAIGLDNLADEAILARLHAGQMAALQAVAQARPAIARAAGLMADVLGANGRVFYAAAGSSALMAMADGLELPGTFGIDADRLHLLMAGGIPTDGRMPGDTEDDTAEAESALADLEKTDLLIALSASGRTPFALAAIKRARQVGAPCIAIANVPGAPLFEGADVALCLPTPPEVIAGSTRLGAGTAQKATLNMISTLAGVRLGHVHDGQMVNLVADNDKLRARAGAMVARIAGVSLARAAQCLTATQGAVKPAVLLAADAPDLAAAKRMLATSGGALRPALGRMGFYDIKTTRNVI